MTEQKIFFITDSACDIPPQEEAQLDNLCILPIPVTADGEGYYERESFTAEEFYDLIERCKEIPVTSHIPSITFQERYGQAWEKGYTHLVVLTIYSGASSMYHSALMAKDAFLEEHPGAMTIEVIDSKTYTYIYGHIVVKAAEMREQGESFDAIVSVVKSRLNRVEAYLGVYSLKFLKKSGRISGGAAFVGEALGLKPISHVYDGAVKVCDKVRGEKALVAGISKKVSARVVQPDKQTAILLYGDVPAERLDEMEKRLRTEIGFRDVERVAIGPSVLTNTGPLAMAVAYYGTPRD